MHRLAAVIVVLASLTLMAGCAIWPCCGKLNLPPYFAGTWRIVEAQDPALVDGRIRVYNKDLTGHLTIPPGKMQRFTFTYDQHTIVENYKGVKVVVQYQYDPNLGIMERRVVGGKGWTRYKRI